jgi:four helix bundle protein
MGLVFETKYWLSLLKDTEYVEEKAFNNIYENPEEISKILFSILRFLVQGLNRDRLVQWGI